MKGSYGSARSRRQTSNPSSFGIITSSRMRSGCARCAAASASSPSAAVTMSYPLAARRICKMWTFVGVSSTIKIRGGVLTPSRPFHRQVRPDLGQELARGKGFRDVRVAARLERLDVVAAQRVRGDHDDRDVPERGIGLDSPGRFVAVEARKLNIHKDQVRPLFRRRDTALAIFRLDELVAHARQEVTRMSRLSS